MSFRRPSREIRTDARRLISPLSAALLTLLLTATVTAQNPEYIAPPGSYTEFDARPGSALEGSAGPPYGGEPAPARRSTVFSPPKSSGRRAATPGAYGRVPTPAAAQPGDGWGDDVAPRLNRPVYSNAAYPHSSSELDPNVALPQQSIGEYAEGPALGMPSACDECPPAAPHGPLKALRGQATWLGGDNLGFTDIEVWSKWDFATISEYSRLTLTPGYGLHLVDGPNSPDLPGQLHDLYLDVQWLNPFSREWAVELGLTPGLYSDFENGTDDAFRLGARIAAYYTMSPVWRFAAGVAYLDRDDVPFFPLGGVIWTPNDDVRLELVLPRPKYAQRFSKGCGSEDWWYVAGEFGGGSWAIERTSDAADKANYSDWRLAVGWERRSTGGPTLLAELGYVFNRSLEYESGGGTFEPDDTFMLRGMVGY